MNNTNKHLDDLFAEARHEDPVISEQNARELLTKGEHMQPSLSLFSTKGIIMSTIGLSLASVLAYVALSGSPQAPVSISGNTVNTNTPLMNLFAHRIGSTDEPKKSESTKKLVIVKKPTDEISTRPIPPLPPLISTPVKVQGIIPMTLPPDKFAIMGISKKDDGTIGFVQTNGDGKKIFTISFPKTHIWGAVIGDDEDLAPGSETPKFSPVIVTDTKGNRRLMQFSGESDNMNTRGMEIHSHIDAPDTKNAVMINIQKNVQINGDENDMEDHDIHSDANEIDETSNDLLQTEEHDHPANGNQVKVIVKANTTEKDTTINGRPQKKIIITKIVRRDSILSSLKGLKLDSIMKTANEALKKAENEIKKMNMDSVIEKANKSIRKANEEIKKLNLDSIIQSATESVIKAEETMAKYDRKLNSLIPILVRPSTTEHVNKTDGITYDDGLIFWYDNTEDFVKAAQSVPIITSYVIAGNTDSTIINPNFKGKKIITATDLSAGNPIPGTNNAVSKTLIYPNPATNSTTVRFALTEPHTVAFSIHDLLGKRVLDGGSVTENSAGSYDHEINLSNLKAGMYLLVITTDTGEQSIQRLVIEK
jgi:hypothetical protein